VIEDDLHFLSINNCHFGRTLRDFNSTRDTCGSRFRVESVMLPFYPLLLLRISSELLLRISSELLLRISSEPF
jgi:hypothetical protein